MLSDAEYELVVRRVRERVPPGRSCIAGISVSSTARAIELAKAALRSGVDGLLVASPPYNKPSQLGIKQHLQAIHSACGLPIIAYDIPGRTGVALHASTIGELARDGTIVGLKDASGSLDHVLDVLACVPPDFAVLSGEDSLTLPTMACGGRGVISATANVAPEKFVALTSSFAAGDLTTAKRLQLELLPLIRLAFSETNPVPVKGTLARMGVLSSGAVRLPLMEAAPGTVQRMHDLISRWAEGRL